MTHSALTRSIPTGAVVLVSALLAGCVPEEREAAECAPAIPAHWPPHIREHWEKYHSGKTTPTPTQAQDGYGAARSEAECKMSNPND